MVEPWFSPRPSGTIAEAAVLRFAVLSASEEVLHNNRVGGCGAAEAPGKGVSFVPHPVRKGGLVERFRAQDQTRDGPAAHGGDAAGVGHRGAFPCGACSDQYEGGLR